MTNNYAGIPDEYAQLHKANVVLIPVPFDGTSTWQKGADKGPEAFLEASKNMELYDIETKSEVFKKGIFLAPAIEQIETVDDMIEELYSTVKDYIRKKKFVTVFGGEHSISIATIRAFNESFENLTVVQLDAHADLRPEYEGSKNNHACALHEASKTTNLVQVGIRSMDASEMEFMDEYQTHFAHEMVNNEDWMNEAINQMSGNIFITFDLDAFDPSILPATGTPEPGGLLWYETLEFLKMIFEERNVVGFDISELCPRPNSKESDFLAAKLYYKMLSYKFHFDSEDEIYDEDDTEDLKLNKYSNGTFDEE